jgi:RND family efflux transporter MFP subunit
MFPLNRKTVGWPWPATLVVVAGMLAGCGRSENAAKGRPAKEPVTVTLAPAELRPMERTITALGTLQAMDRATVSIKTTGRLRTLGVDVGSPVKAGDILAQIEPRDYELRLQQAAAFLAQARARLGLTIEGGDDAIEVEKVSVVREAAALLDEAEKNLERIRKLQTEKISSQSELERATAEHQVTLNRYQDATSLRAPFDGVVQARLTNVGEFLSSGSPVLTLVRIDPLRLRSEIPERQAPLVRAGQLVRMTLEGNTNIHSGNLARVSPALDDRTRMLLVEAEFKNPGHLRPGAFVRAEIVVEAAAPTLTIPADALVTFAGTEKAFIVATNSAVEKRIVSGRRNGQWIEVVQGLKPGDQVVRNPGGLQSGDPVRVNGAPPVAATVQASTIPLDAKAR